MASTQVVVVNRSGLPGLATRVSASLAQLGYRVGTPTEGSFLSQSRIVDRSGGTGAAALQQLSRDLGLVGPDVLAEGDGGGGIAVELGGDAADLSIDAPPDDAAPAGGSNIVQVGPWNPASSSPTQQTPLEPGRGAQPGATSGREGLHATPIPVPGNAKFVVVPRLVGLPESVAQQFINESDLMTTYVNYQTIDQVPDHALFLSTPPGAVLSQLPPPGTQVPRGTRIMLAVRKQ
jgi:hypothetical protein